MTKTTRAQREALFCVFQRDFPSWISPGKRRHRHSKYGYYTGPAIPMPTTQWRNFRKRVRPAFGDTCIMIHWQGMWLGIEADGYTHS